MKNLQDLYENELRDLFSVESQIIKALPEMMEKAENSKLKKRLKKHLKKTEKQRDRLEKINQRMDKGNPRMVCEAMEAILSEAQEMIEEAQEADVRDAAIIAGARRVEHFEIAGYSTLATYAKTLGHSKDHERLLESLSEEKKADKKLRKIAKKMVNLDVETA